MGGPQTRIGLSLKEAHKQILPPGLSVAAAAAAFGRKVVLIERHKMGGDCLNYGCVPSKSMIGAARLAASARRAPSTSRRRSISRSARRSA